MCQTYLRVPICGTEGHLPWQCPKLQHQLLLLQHQVVAHVRQRVLALLPADCKIGARKGLVSLLFCEASARQLEIMDEPYGGQTANFDRLRLSLCTCMCQRVTGGMAYLAAPSLIDLSENADLGVYE